MEGEKNNINSAESCGEYLAVSAGLKGQESLLVAFSGHGAPWGTRPAPKLGRWSYVCQTASLFRMKV